MIGACTLMYIHITIPYIRTWSTRALWSTTSGAAKVPPRQRTLSAHSAAAATSWSLVNLIGVPELESTWSLYTLLIFYDVYIFLYNMFMYYICIYIYIYNQSLLLYMCNIRKLRPGTLPIVPHMTFANDDDGTQCMTTFLRNRLLVPSEDVPLDHLFGTPINFDFQLSFFGSPIFLCNRKFLDLHFQLIFFPWWRWIFPAPPRQWPAAIIMNILVAANTSMSWLALPERQLETPNGNQITVWLMVYIPRDPITETENGNGT